MRTLIISAVILLSAVTASAQSDLAQALQKALDEVEASRALITAQKDQIALQEKLLSQKDELINAYKAESEARQKVIDVLSAIKCNERTIAFKPFGWSIIKHTKKTCF